jgi:hypothetical protein
MKHTSANFSLITFVCGDRELIARIGHPSSSVAYNTRDPKGDPLYLCIV